MDFYVHECITKKVFWKKFRTWILQNLRICGSLVLNVCFINLEFSARKRLSHKEVI